MKVLLHICCAPCAITPFGELTKENGHPPTGFFYNPNIHPYSEMEKRRLAIVNYAAKEGFEVIYGDYDIENFFRDIALNMKAPSRCHLCWRMRLRKTASVAKEKGYDAFTTTLLVSPYQDRQTITRIGAELGEEFGVKFIEHDWRGGFIAAQQLARERDMYRQKYCGCVFSEKERFCKQNSDYRLKTED